MRATLLLAAYALVLWACVEFAFPRLARHLPPRMGVFFDQDFLPLMQVSKRGMLPQGEYIALLGDSYAYGAGDWRDTVPPREYGSILPALHMHREFGIDVVNFGIPGSGSIEALVIHPISSLHALNTRFKIGVPSHFVYFYYEGNDAGDDTSIFNADLTRYPSLERTDTENGLEAGMFHAALDDIVRERTGLSTRIRAHTIATRFFAAIVTADRSRDPVTLKADNAVRIGTTSVRIGSAVHGPSPVLDLRMARFAFEVLEESMRFHRRAFPSSTLTIVYIPSPASLYDFEGNPIMASSRGATVEDAQTNVRLRHEAFRSALERIASDAGANFFDATPVLREAAQSSVLHGPHDWNHFNAEGYKVFNAAVVEYLREAGVAAGDSGLR